MSFVTFIIGVVGGWCVGHFLTSPAQFKKVAALVRGKL